MTELRGSAALLALVVVAGCSPEISNRPPVARGGDDQLVYRGDTVTLDGAASFDPDDDTLTFTWSFVSGPAAVQPGVGASFSFTPVIPGSYVFSLAVSDGVAAVHDIVGVEVKNDLRVTAITPGPAGTLASRDPVVVHFDAPIRPWTVNGALTVEDVTDPQAPVPVLGNVSLDDAARAIVFSPVVDWVDTTDYRVTVAPGPLALDGAPMRAPVTSSFTGLDATLDLTAPYVLAVSPPDLAVDQPLSTIVEVYFSEPVEVATLGSAFTLVAAGPVPGTLTLTAGGTHMTFTPAVANDPQALASATAHVVTLAAGLQDLRGNATGNATTSTFTTTAANDTTPPSVLWVSPLLGANDVSVKLPVVFGLSEPVEPASILATLGTNGAAGVSAQVSTAMGNTVVVVTPDANLRTATRYDALLAAGLTDLSGNAMAADFASHFRTGLAPPPTVAALVPDRGSIGSTFVTQIVGEDFLPGAAAFVLGGGVLVSDTNYIAPDTIEATLTIAPNATIGPRSVTVTNPDGQQGTALSVFDVLRRPPLVSSLTPNAANRGQTNVPIVLLGSDFQSGATVAIAGSDVTISGLTFLSANELRFNVTVAAGAAVGDRDVTVTNPDGQSHTLAAGFRVRFPAPTVTAALSPSSGGQGQSLASVVITGTGFLTTPALPTVSLGSGILATTVAANATSVTVNLTIDVSAATGARTVTVTNPDGQAASRANSFTVFNAPPQIVSVSPAVSQGQSNVVVTVTGASFGCAAPTFPQLQIETGGVPSAGVTVGALQAGCTANSFSRLVTVTGAAAVGQHDVRVTNSDGQFGTKAGAFTVREEIPTLTSLSVIAGRRKQNLAVTINGTSFQPNPIVSFGPDIAVSVGAVTPTAIAANISIQDTAALGARSVTVTNADGQSVTSANAFTVQRALPDLVSISPSPVNQQTAFVLTASGGDFDCTTAPTVSVRQAGAPSTGVTVNNASGTCDATTITRNVSIAANAPVGLHDVRVANPDGGFDELSSVLQIREEAPTLASLSVTSGRRKQTLSLTISGGFFQANPSVSFGANVGVSVGTVVNPGTAASSVPVTITIQDGAALGLRGVTLTNPDGQSATLANAFTVNKALPDLLSLAPSSANQQQSPTVTLTGTDFDCSTATPPAVSFGDGAIATAVSCPGSSETEASLSVVATIGAAAVVGSKNVTVTNPDGGADVLPGSFTVREEAPVISSLSVTSGRRKQTLSLTIAGSWFLANPTVSFGPNVGVSVGAVVNPGTAASQIPVTLTIETTAGLGARNVTVTNSDGQSVTATNAFTIEKAPPDLVSLAPAGANQQTSALVTLTGTDFDCSGAPATRPSVSFGDAAITTNVSCNGSTSDAATTLLVTTTVGAASIVGPHDVTVTNPAGASDVLSGAFSVREEAPQIASLSVTSGRRKGTVSLTIAGAYFLASPTISFGANIAVSAGPVVNPGTVSSSVPVTIAIENAAALGARNVTITNSDGQSFTATNAFTVQKALPDLVSLAPASANQQQSLTVTLTGTDFDCSAAPGTRPAVSYGDGAISAVVSCNGSTSEAATALLVTTTVGAAAIAGPHDVTVTNPDGGVDALAGAFTVREEAPQISSLSVTSGRRKQTLSLTINGSWFLANPTVSFGADVAVSAGPVVNPGTASSSIPVTITIQNAAALGARNVTVTNSDGQSATAANAFTVQRALPDLVSVAPPVANQQTSTVVTLTGTDFDCSGAPATRPSVSYGDAAITASVSCNGSTSDAATSLLVTTTVGAAALVSAHDVTVTNPDLGADTLAGAFIVREESPEITSLTVTSGRRKGTVSLTIAGRYFLANPTISFGANIAVSAGSVVGAGTAASTVPVTIAIENAAVLGARNVTITNSDGQSFTATGAFTVRNALPDLVSISPSSANQQQSLLVTLTGTDFDCSAAPATRPSVSYGDAAITAGVSCNGSTSEAATTLLVTTTVGAAALVSTHDVTVTNPDLGADTLAGAFTVREEAPEFASLSTTSGRRKQTLSLTISGRYILANPTVSFGADIAVSAGAVVNPGTTTSQVPVTITIQDAAALGARAVTVTNPDGQSFVAANAFTVAKAPPIVAGVSPASGSQGSTIPVTVTGDDFDCTGVLPALSFGDPGISVAMLACPGGSTVSEDTLTASVTIGAASTVGLHQVTVTNADGGSGVLANGFDVDEEPPQVTAINPASGRRRQTLTVDVMGAFFQDAPPPTVSFGAGVGVSSVTFVNTTTLQVAVSVSETAALGLRSVNVTNKDGQGTTFPNAFEVKRAVPSVVSIAPASGNQQQAPFVATITGDHFDCSGAAPMVSLNDAAIAVSGVSCGASTSQFATSLTATLTIGAAATVSLHDVSVTNAGDSVTGVGVGLFQVREEPPTISSLSVVNGRRKQTLSLTISGSYFLANPTVSFGPNIGVSAGAVAGAGTAASSVPVTITIDDAAALGPRDVTLTNSDGQSFVATGAFEVRRALPDLVSIAPAILNQQQSTVVTLSGTDFDCSGAPAVAPSVSYADAAISASVSCNGSTSGAATTLLVTTTAAASALVGGHDVVVTNPDGGQDTLAGAFTVREEAPEITSLSVVSGRRKGTVSLTISGRWILANPTISYGANIAVSAGAVVNPGTASSSVPVTIAIENAASLGARGVTLTNADGQSVTVANAFTVQKALPDLVSVAPASANQRATLVVTLTGTDFDCSGAPATRPGVSFADAAISTDVSCNGSTSEAATSLLVTTTVGAAAVVGAHDATVTNPDGGADALTGAFAVREEAPVFGSLTTASGRRKQTLSLTILAQYLNANPTVSFGSDVGVSVGAVVNPGTAASQVPVTITIQPAAALGPRDVVVTNADGQGFTASGAFTVQKALPDLVSIAPAVGNQGQTLPVTLTGTDFDCSGAPAVRPAVDAGANVTATVTCPGTSETETTLSVSFAIGATAAVGGHDVTVTNPDGGADAPLTGALTVREEAPVFTSLSVTGGRRRETLAVTVTGNFFQPGVSVSFGSGVLVTVGTVTQNSIAVTLDIARTAPPGSRDVTVTNPDGQSVTSTGAFTVRKANPTVTSVDAPARGSQRTTVPVVIRGDDFDCNGAVPGVSLGDLSISIASVDCNGGATDFETRLNATAVIGSNATIGLHTVTVTNPPAGGLGNGVGTLPNAFDVLEEAPLVTSLGAGAGRRRSSMSVTIFGDFFQAGPSVSFGSGIGVSVTSVTPTQIVVNLSIDESAALGMRTVTVTNVDGQSDTLPASFEVLRANPTVASITPNAGSQQGAPFVATILGTHFDCSGTPPSVTISGGVGVSGVTCPSPLLASTALTATITVPAGATTGLQSVTVSGPLVAGDLPSGTQANLFTVREEAPSLTSASPNPKQNETANVTLAGAFFQSTPAVPVVSTTAPGVTVNSVAFVSATELSVSLTVDLTTPVGTYAVTVTNADGQQVTANVLTIDAARTPVVSSVVPPRAQNGQTLTVTIDGTDFQPGTGVAELDFGAGITVDSVLAVSANAITAQITVAGGAAFGPRTVSVDTVSIPVATGSLPNGFHVTDVPPTVTSVTPNNGTQGTTVVNVVVQGTDFRTGAVPDFGPGTSVSNVVVTVPNMITCDVTLDSTSPPGPHDVTVINTDTSRGTLAGSFTVISISGGPTITAVVRDPSRGAVATRNDTANSLRQGESALFHILGFNFQSGATVTVSGTGVTASAVTFVSTQRIDVTLTLACGDLAPGPRDLTVTNPPVGNGLSGTVTNGFVVRTGVVINEVATQDRTDHGFGQTREVLEIVNGSSCTWDVTGWRLDIIQGTPAIYEIGTRPASELFSGGSTRAAFVANGYLIIDRPYNAASDAMADNVYIALVSVTGRNVDDVEIGDNEENDATNDGAVAAGNNGANASAADEMVARCPNGFDTDGDIADFFQNELGGFAAAATNRASNNAECPPCADGVDNDGDGWVDLLDGGCSTAGVPDPVNADETGDPVTECSNGADNADPEDALADEADPDCFDGLDNTEAR